MTPEQLQQLRAKLASGRQPEARADQYAFPRGWNAAFDTVEKWIKEVTGEKV